MSNNKSPKYYTPQPSRAQIAVNVSNQFCRIVTKAIEQGCLAQYDVNLFCGVPAAAMRWPRQHHEDVPISEWIPEDLTTDPFPYALVERKSGRIALLISLVNDRPQEWQSWVNTKEGVKALMLPLSVLSRTEEGTLKRIAAALDLAANGVSLWFSAQPVEDRWLPYLQPVHLAEPLSSAEASFPAYGWSTTTLGHRWGFCRLCRYEPEDGSIRFSLYCPPARLRRSLLPPVPKRSQTSPSLSCQLHRLKEGLPLSDDVAIKQARQLADLPLFSLFPNSGFKLKLLKDHVPNTATLGEACAAVRDKLAVESAENLPADALVAMRLIVEALKAQKGGMPHA